MFKKINLPLSFVLVLVLSSCGGSGNQESESSNTNMTAPAPDGNSPTYKVEVLKNPTFDMPEGWVLTTPSVYDAESKSVRVTFSNLATQPVPVVPGEKYKIEASVRALKSGSLFRLQVNWLNDKGEMVAADIEPLEAKSDYGTYTKFVVVPTGATVAVVYAQGHASGDEIEYTSLSFSK